jgi:hypothetical protein
MTEELYLGQLRRLLRSDQDGRQAYDSMVNDIVGSTDPLMLFHQSGPRPGVYFVEALYKAHTELATGDMAARPSLAPLGYSRWLAWRLFGEAVKNRDVAFDCRVTDFEAASRDDVIGHLGAGWRPPSKHGDPELDTLILRYS